MEPYIRLDIVLFLENINACINNLEHHVITIKK